MRRIQFTQTQDDAGIDMTPMLDVVFIMLIFFIVSTSFVRESGIEVNRPSSQTSSEQTQSVVMIAISAQGQIWLDRKATDVRMVRPVLERLRAEQPGLSVVVQADSKSTTGDLVQLIDQLRLAGVQYTVATKSSD
ncbi:ExbD/TolR family protein [Oceanospirillum beijerinckii]|uniref:ExbD/TolR family protein n=1 Tax=Oceanospirillum beijerinckii TaxID=64976 RepID=UPI0004292F67|nr:biopolymer transporter ExbD [Oceanospirillum beijerinckii]